MRLGILSRAIGAYSTRALTIAASRAGHHTVVMDPWKCALYLRAGSPRVAYDGSPVDHLDAVIARFGSATAPYGLEVLRQFESAGALTLNSAEAVETARHKWRSLLAFEKAGLPIPPTFTAGDPEVLEKAVKRIGGYPFIAKPFQGTQGSGIILFETPVSAKSTLSALWSLSRNYIGQQFYPEAEGVDIRAMVIGEKVEGAMRRVAPKGEFRANLHCGGSGYATRISPSMERLAVAAAKAVGLGFAGVDMLQVGQDVYLLEANPSPGLEGMESATGIDMAARVIRHVETLVKGR